MSYLRNIVSNLAIAVRALFVARICCWVQHTNLVNLESQLWRYLNEKRNGFSRLRIYSLCIMICPVLILGSSICIIPVKADIVWSDNFDDGDMDGWTNLMYEWYVSNGCLCSPYSEEGMVYHDSKVANGTWSLEFKCIPGSGYSPTGRIIMSEFNLYFVGFVSGLKLTGYQFSVTHPSEEVYGMTLWRRAEGADAILDHCDLTGNYTGWQKINITRNVDGDMHVYLNTTHILNATDTTFSNSQILAIRASFGPQRFSEFIVSDTVDIQAPEPITTETTTQYTTIFESTSLNDVSLPLDSILVPLLASGGVFTIVIIIVIMKRKY